VGPCGSVYDYAQMFADPQARQRGLVQSPSDPNWARCRTFAPRQIGQGVRSRAVAHRLGQHNAEISGRLGVSEAEIKRLRAQGVV